MKKVKIVDADPNDLESELDSEMAAPFTGYM